MIRSFIINKLFKCNSSYSKSWQPMKTSTKKERKIEKRKVIKRKRIRKSRK